MEYIIKVSNFDQKNLSINNLNELSNSKDTNCSDDEEDSDEEQMKSSLNTVSGSVDQVNALDLVKLNEFIDPKQNSQRDSQIFNKNKKFEKNADDGKLTKEKAAQDLKNIQQKLNDYKKLCGQSVRFETKTFNCQFMLNHVRFSQDNELNLDYRFSKNDGDQILKKNLSENLDVLADKY